MTKDVELSKLETYFKKAVNASNDDLDISSIDGIVNILKAHPDLSYEFTKIMIPLLRSSNIRESLLSLEALEEFMDSALPEFQIEVSKFRFLNELIRLVSKKYEGNQTPKEIKDRILDVLFTWTDKYPDLTKIKDCYEMLKTQGIVHEPIKNVIKNNRRQEEHKDSTLKLMESEKFKKLLQSKNPRDLQAANLMIQNMVRDNDRRLQLQSRRLIEVKRAHENSILLMEMLDAGLGVQDEDTQNTMKEIYNNCEKLKPTIARLAEESQDNEKFLEEILQTSDSLNAALEKYRTVIIEKQPITKIIKELASNNLLELHNSKGPGSSAPGTSIDELNDIFSNLNNFSKATENNFKNEDILSPSVLEVSKPSPTIDIDIKSLIQPSVSNNFTGDSKHSDFDLLQDIDLNVKGPIVINKPVLKEAEKPLSKLADIDSLVSGMKNKMMSSSTPVMEDDKMLEDFSEEIVKEQEILINSPKKEDKILDLIPEKKEKVPEPVKKSLAELDIDINNIEPSDEPPRVILDEVKGIKIMLNFAKDRPRDDVLVVVITVMNQGSQQIKNFHFDSCVPKPCKLRLLSPSCTELPAVKGWKPPTELITQVLLLSNPTEKPVSILCILTYCLGEDPDPVRESIEVKDIPYICQ